MAAPRPDAPVVAAFAFNAVLAGGNAVAIRFSNRELAPLWGATLRFAVAASILAALMALKRLSLPRGRALAGAALYGALQFAGAFGLYYYALRRLQAGRGQTLLALVPLATLLLAVAQRQERLRASAVAGSVLGLAGVALMSSTSAGADVPALSVAAVLGSVLCFAQAGIVVRRFPAVHPVAANAVGMTVGTALLAAASLLWGEAWVLPQRAATWTALAYVAIAGSVAVFMLYVFILHRWTASRAAYVMVVIPLVTIALSAWLDDERLRAGMVAGALLIVAGVYVGALRVRPAGP